MSYKSEQGNFCLMSVGDILVSQQLAVFNEPRYLALRDLLHSGDIAFANLETVLHRFNHWPGIAGGTFTGCDPAIVEDLKWLGLKVVSIANNHSLDYGIPGLLETFEHLRLHRFPNAGAGMNLADAAEPIYVDTAMGRAAFIACTTTLAPGAEAIEQRSDHVGRPGVNPLRVDRRFVVDASSLEMLAVLKSKLKIGAGELQRRIGANDPVFTFLGQPFELGEEIGTHATVSEPDLRRNLQRIAEARQMADWVFFSCHYHEQVVERGAPPAYIEAFAHACIDAGVDVFMGHGPHSAGAIEIYKQRPIFYSLGNFVFQAETVRKQPACNYDAFGLGPDANVAEFQNNRNRAIGFQNFGEYWHSFVAKTVFRKGKLDQVEIHPVELGFGQPRYRRGRPILADEESAIYTLGKLQELSRPFNTQVERLGCVGKVCL